MSTVHKSPLRHVRYLALLFRTEFLFGGAERRRYFIRRLVDRVAVRLGLFAIPEYLFMARLALRYRQDRRHYLGLREWRYHRWFWAIERLQDSDNLRSWVVGRASSRPKIIVMGTGSIGDVLQITPVLRVMREMFPTAQIALLHRSLIAKKILRGNPNVDVIVQEADFYAFDQIKRSVETEGAVDLIVDVQSVTYRITYTVAPPEMRHPDIDRVITPEFLAKAEAARDFWRDAPTQKLDAQNKCAWSSIWRGRHFLDALGATGNLPIGRNSPLDFYIEDGADAILRRFPQGHVFVTVQNGVDADVMNWSRVTGQYPTKLLPLAIWREVVQLLSDKKLFVVQLGGKDDALIDGVSLDLRGATSLSEAAVLLRNAAAHVGTEGGLVHLSRAVGGKSVVLFGPTAVDFFGYPGNVNVQASDCTGCWRAKRDWFIYCPRGLAEAECMNAFQPEAIVEAIIKNVSEKHYIYQ